MDLLEIELKADKKIIYETLSRIGVGNKREKILYPSCYLFEQDGKNYLAHFKELFYLVRTDSFDGMVEEDFNRRNAVAYLLKKWNLIDVDEEKIIPHDKKLFILPYEEKREWKIDHKIKYRNP